MRPGPATGDTLWLCCGFEVPIGGAFGGIGLRVPMDAADWMVKYDRQWSVIDGGRKGVEMPKGYLIFTEAVTDRGALDAYAQKAVPTVLGSGGVPVIAGPAEEVIEGDWHGDQTVIIEFESVEAARAWYNSDAYQAIIGERHAAAESNAAIFAGFEMPTG